MKKRHLWGIIPFSNQLQNKLKQKSIVKNFVVVNFPKKTNSQQRKDIETDCEFRFI